MIQADHMASKAIEASKMISQANIFGKLDKYVTRQRNTARKFLVTLSEIKGFLKIKVSRELKKYI